MKIHWAAKWISFSYDAHTVLLHGILLELQEGSVVPLLQLSCDDMDLSKHVDQMLDSQLPPEILNLLQSHSEVFASKVSYPPPRACTHITPLIPGATPFAIRPYTYALVLKSEIEQQVKEMLQAGLIQPSTSAFSSPLLLVKKKKIRPIIFVWIIEI
jgi:hypothetical protein